MLAIDALGGSITAVFVLVFLWLVLIQNRATTSEVKQLGLTVQTARNGFAQVRGACDRLRASLASHQDELQRTGQLPDQPPVEEYFQTLSELASRNQLRVVGHSPLASRTYPGLLEQRFAYEVVGSAPDLISFLVAIEHTDFWGDVSYFTIDKGRPSAGGVVNRRAAALTISLFSAPPITVEGDGG